MTLFFTPSSGTEWAGGSVAAARTRLLRGGPQSLSGTGGDIPAARPTPWRTIFPAFRVQSAVREVVLSGAGGALLLLPEPSALAWALVPALAIPVAVAAAGGYRWRVLGEGRLEERAVLRAGATVLAALVVLGFLGVLAVPVFLATVATPAALALVIVGRRVARRGVVRRRQLGHGRLRTLVVGPSVSVNHFLENAAQAPGAGYHVVGWFGSVEGAPAPASVPALGPLTDVDVLGDVSAEHDVDVVVLVGENEPTTARRVSWALEGTRASLVLVPSVSEIGSDRISVHPTDDLWSVQLDVAPRPRSFRLKGLVDRALGTALLSVAAFILVPVMVAVRLTSPGKALYKQQRIGRDGVPFTMWKVRSMYVDADARRAALVGQAGDGNGLLFKMRQDPRVTPLGRVLRRLSIDELPQLYNVVRGDMSIVGPRPALAEETSRYVGDEPRRLAVKPGLTGLWQVSGRSDLTREQSMRLDLRYVDNVSLALDASILGRTFRAVSRGLGAY